MSMEDILDGTLDDLADLPEFKPFPNGAHKCIITFERKEVNKHPAVEVTLKAIETVELADPAQDQPLAKDTTTGVLYMLDNEIGQGKFKELMKVFAPIHGEGLKLSALMQAAQNTEAVVVTEKRSNKEKTKEYTDIKNVLFA